MVCANNLLSRLNSVESKIILINEVSNNAAFKKLWSNILKKAKMSATRPNEIVNGFSIIATKYNLNGLRVPTELMGKSVFDPKSGRIISLLGNGKEALLLEF